MKQEGLACKIYKIDLTCHLILSRVTLWFLSFSAPHLLLAYLQVKYKFVPFKLAFAMAILLQLNINKTNFLIISHYTINMNRATLVRIIIDVLNSYIIGELIRNTITVCIDCIIVVNVSSISIIASSLLCQKNSQFN